MFLLPFFSFWFVLSKLWIQIKIPTIICWANQLKKLNMTIFIHKKDCYNFKIPSIAQLLDVRFVHLNKFVPSASIPITQVSLMGNVSVLGLHTKNLIPMASATIVMPQVVLPVLLGQNILVANVWTLKPL